MLAYIGLGSNLNNPKQQIKDALIALDNVEVRLAVVDLLADLQLHLANRDSKKGVKTIKAHLKLKKKELLRVIDELNEKASQGSGTR